MPSARARHILVSSEDQATDIKQQIAGGADFGAMAKEHSTCPSSANGGDLGQFGPGQMVPEFDAVIWKEPIGEVVGPVKTAFGYHLVEVLERED
jgi:peptidyl-prolyl cis-trans isomerase C